MLRIYILSAIFIIGVFSCKNYRFEMGSEEMEPNIKQGSFVIAKEQQEYTYGDVVYMDSISTYSLLYRIVALGGDSIALEDNICILNGEKYKTEHVERIHIEGHLAVNELIEKWTNGTQLKILIKEGGLHPEQDNITPVRVPENHVYVLGDNRSSSMDSRAHGFIPVEKIKGKVVWFLNK